MGSATGWYARGSSISVTAIAATGYQFEAWTDGVPIDATNVNPLTLGMDQARNLSARFGLLPVTSSIMADAFAYATGSVAGAGGGVGWISAWAGAGTVVTSRFSSVLGYPDVQGGSLEARGQDSTRGFAAVTNGRLYAAFMMRYETNGGFKTGMILTEGGAYRIFFGYHSYAPGLYLFEYPGNQQYGLSHSMTNRASYLVIASFDLDGKFMRCMMLTNDLGYLPPQEPETWPLQGAFNARRFDGLKLLGGEGGDPIYDEVRLARRWEDLTVPGAISNVTLTIRSAHGIAFPAVGVYTQIPGIMTTNRIVSPMIIGSTQFVCTGWTMTGNEPAQGSGLRMVATVTNNAVLTWLWTTGAAAAGSVVAIAEPFDYASGAPLSGLAGGYGWSGSWAGCVLAVSTSQFESLPGYVPVSGGSVYAADVGATRHFAAITGGVVYVAFMLRYDSDASPLAHGIVLGEGSGFPGAIALNEGTFYNNGLSFVEILGGGYNHRGVSGTMSTGRSYLVVAAFDLASRYAMATVITNAGATFPSTPPTQWTIALSNQLSRLGRVTLEFQSATALDELRITTDWAELSRGYLNPRLDSDGDGISDLWEAGWFGSLTNVNGGSDWDGDFYYDWQEAGAGTNPKDPQSFLGMQMPASYPGPNGIVVQWKSVTGKWYQVDRSSQLPTGFSGILHQIAGQLDRTIVTDTTANVSAPNFYRISLEP
jgi:hypothetical protein